MNKKIISVFTLLAFIFFSISCYTTSIKDVKTAADWHGKKRKVLSIVKISGEYIEFNKENPGRIDEDKIVGTAIMMSKKIEIERANTKKIKKHSDGSIFEIINKEGKIYPVIGKVNEEENKFIFFATYETFESVSISLSEIKSIRIKRINRPFMYLAIAVGVVAVGYGAVFAAFALWYED